MDIIEKRGEVIFFKKEDKIFQQVPCINNGKPFKITNGNIRYEFIKEIGKDYVINYNLNGVYGFSVSRKDGTILEDGFWTLKEAEECAKFLNLK